MGQLMAIDPVIGCPSGLQKTPVQAHDPFGGQLDLSAYVTHMQEGQCALDLVVQGAHCAGCVSKIERNLSALPGVTNVRMNLSTMRLSVRWSAQEVQANTILKALTELGFGAAPYAIDAAQNQSETELKFLLRAIAVAGFAVMNIMLLSIAVWSGAGEMSAQTRGLFHVISALIAIPTVLYSGRPFFQSAWGALKQRSTNMDVPISLAVILACSLSLYETVNGNPDTYFDAAVMLLFLLLIGRYLDARLRMRTGDAARRLAAMQVTSATRILDNGGIETVPASAITPGDRLIIPAGQRLPVDCQIETGTSEIDMHIATGESKPIVSGPNDMLYSGTINLTAPLTARAVALSTNSFLSEITRLVEAGEQSKSRFVKIADRAARIYVPFVHSIAIVTFAGWLIAGADLRMAALCAIAVLIITCPCALGLAVPAVQIVAAGRLFKSGVLIRSGDALERLAKTKRVIFDKTGTLTMGQFHLVNEEALTARDLHFAAALAKHSIHPISLALRPYIHETTAETVHEIPGQGLTGYIEGKRVKFGSASFIGQNIHDEANGASWLHTQGENPVKFEFRDEPRREAVNVISKLKRQGLSVELLSGDQKFIAEQTAHDLGIEQWSGEVTPKQKMDLLHKRKSQGCFPLMVGDGINDAPALAAANSSAAPATAADVARSAADIILQGDKLSGLPIAIQTARNAQRRVIENLSLAILYNIIAIPLAILGLVNPLIAALAMSGSSLLVTLNALRMARI